MQPTEAILIRLTRLTETSLIVHWFTETQGLIKTVAKGARRPKSHFAGQLDLFFGGEITLTRSRHSELHTLREVAIRHWRGGLRRNYTTTLLAAYFCQLLEMAVEPEHPLPELYDLLKRALDHLETAEPSLRILEHFEKELARLLGVFLDSSHVEILLRDLLGTLPANRVELIERLSPRDAFLSSGAKNCE